MNRAVRLFLVTQAEQSLLHDVLKVRLSDVDDVVDSMAVSEGRHILASRRRARDPYVLFFVEQLVVKILIEQADLPKLISDILADIRYCAVRSNNDFVVFVPLGIEAHDPATCVLAFLLIENRIPFSKQPACMVPKLQMK